MFESIYAKINAQVNRERTLSLKYVFYMFRKLPVTLDDLAMAYLIRKHYRHLLFDYDAYIEAKIWEIFKKHSTLLAKRKYAGHKNRYKRLTRKMSYLEKDMNYLKDIREVLRGR